MAVIYRSTMVRMTTPLWVPLVAAAVSGASGVAGALGGARLVQKATLEREERQYQRQRRDRREELLEQLLLDMAQHVESTVHWIDMVTDDVTPWTDPSPDYAIPTVRLTPRVELHTEGKVFDHWKAYVWQIEVFDEADRMAGPHASWSACDKGVLELRTVVDEVRGAIIGSAKMLTSSA
jgi:hypothetical protein